MIISNLSRRYTESVLIILCLCMGCKFESKSDTEPLNHIIPANSISKGSTVHDVNYAEGFRIHEGTEYTYLEVLNPFQNKVDTVRYLLKSVGDTLQTEVTDFAGQVINLPLRSIVVTTTTQIGYLKELEKSTLISSIADPEYVYDESIRKRIENNEIVTFSGGNVNLEQVISLDPDLMFISGGQASQYDEYKMLIDSGIHIFVISEWLEDTPLGRAEWIKVMGILTGSEKKSERIFNSVKSRYEKLAQLVKGIDDRPMVINNLPYKGSWFIPGSDSYVVKLLQDAGSSYPWLNRSKSVTLQLDFESVYEKGLDADVWLTPGTATSKSQILQQDERLEDFKAFHENRIYNNTRRINELGGNDYWESGVVYPDRILADLIHILHPELLPDRELYYYEMVK